VLRQLPPAAAATRLTKSKHPANDQGDGALKESKEIVPNDPHRNPPRWDSAPHRKLGRRHCDRRHPRKHLEHMGSSRRGGEGMSAIPEYLRGADLRGADLRGPPSGPTFAGPTCAGPTCAGPTCAGPTFAGPTFTGPTFAGPTFTGPTFAGPTFTGPTCAGPTFTGPACAGPTFAGPTFTGPTFAGPTFAGPRPAGRCSQCPPRADG